MGGGQCSAHGRGRTVVAQGELWLLTLPDSKARPVLVVTRSEVIPVLREVVVAPVTSTIRTGPTFIPVGPDDGIDHDSVAAMDGIGAVPKAYLTVRLGSIDAARRSLICSALNALADC